MGDHLDARAIGGEKRVGVARVDVVGDPHFGRIGALDEKEHRRAVALLGHQGQLQHVPRATIGLGIGKFGHAGAAAQGDRLDLDIGIWLALGRQQKVDPALFSVSHFGAHLGVVVERRHLARLQRGLQHPVRHRGIDPGEMPVWKLDQPPAEIELFLRVVIGLEPDPRAGAGKPQHRAGVGAMGGNLGAIVQPAIGEEAFVAADQRGGHEGGCKFHPPKMGAAVRNVYAGA